MATSLRRRGQLDRSSLADSYDRVVYESATAVPKLFEPGLRQNAGYVGSVRLGHARGAGMGIWRLSTLDGNSR
jgi:hypothetical protein